MTLTRRLVGAAAVTALAVWSATTEARDPVPAAANEKQAAADLAHLTKLAESAKASPTKKTLLGRMKVTAAMAATAAPGYTASALKVAAAAGKKDLAGTAAASAEMASAKGDGKPAAKPAEIMKDAKLDIDGVMHIMGASGGGGMNIEKDIQAWAKSGVKDPAAAAVLGSRVAVLADFTHDCEVEFGGKKTKADWEKWSKAMKEAGGALAAEATKAKPDAAKMKSAASKIDATCTDCHNVFKDS